MGNSLSSKKEITQTSTATNPDAVIPLKPTRSFPDRLKKLAQSNITHLLAKRGWKLSPNYHLKLSLPDNQLTLETVLKFLHRNRMRIASIRKLSIFLDAREIIPLLLTRVPVRPLIKCLGRRLSRLRNLEAAEIGSSHLNAFGIEETLIESIAKMKKITSLTLGVPDNQNKINVISKKLGNLKTISKLSLNFYVYSGSIKPVLNCLKSLSRLEVLKINLRECSIPIGAISKLAETLKKLKRLQYFVIHLENTTVGNEEVKALFEAIQGHPRIENFRIYIQGCSEVSLWLRAKIYAKGNFDAMHPC